MIVTSNPKEERKCPKCKKLQKWYQEPGGIFYEGKSCHHKISDSEFRNYKEPAMIQPRKEVMTLRCPKCNEILIKVYPYCVADKLQGIPFGCGVCINRQIELENKTNKKK